VALSFEEGCQESLVVVDPTRGEVFSEFGVKVLSVQGNTISVGYYTDTEWEKDCETPKKRMKPYKTKNYSLSALLKRRVTAPRPTKGA